MYKLAKYLKNKFDLRIAAAMIGTSVSEAYGK